MLFFRQSFYVYTNRSFASKLASNRKKTRVIFYGKITQKYEQYDSGMIFLIM